MAKNRQAAHNTAIAYIAKLTPGSGNAERYEKILSSMSDAEFDRYIQGLKSKDKILYVTEPIYGKKTISVENNLKLAEQLGYSFFQKLWIGGTGNSPTYQTPNTYLVLDVPVRRASQILTKKRSIPKNMRVVDSLTGQPTGESKGAKISYPELQVAAAMGLEKNMIELMKYRGGDTRGGAALSGMLTKFGKVSLDTLKPYASGVESTKLLNTYLLAAMLKSTL